MTLDTPTRKVIAAGGSDHFYCNIPLEPRQIYIRNFDAFSDKSVLSHAKVVESSKFLMIIVEAFGHHIKRSTFVVQAFLGKLGRAPGWGVVWLADPSPAAWCDDALL